MKWKCAKCTAVKIVYLIVILLNCIVIMNELVRPLLILFPSFSLSLTFGHTYLFLRANFTKLNLNMDYSKPRLKLI